MKNSNYYDIGDFTTVFVIILVILRRESYEWLESSSIGSDLLGMRSAIWSLDVPFHDYAFFKHSLWCKSRLLKRVSYLLIFVIRPENEIPDPLFLLFVNRARAPLYDRLV